MTVSSSGVPQASGQALRETRRGRKAHKRGDGEGTVYQRSGGLWVGELMVGRRPDGKPDRRKVSAKTRGEVQKKPDALRQRVRNGMVAAVDVERQSLGAFLDRWLEAIRPTVRPSTWKRYGQVVRLDILPTLANVRLRDLRADQLQRLYARRLADGMAPRSVLKTHVLLHRALKMAMRWGYMSRNLAEAVEPPSPPRHNITLPEPADLARLVDTAHERGDRLAALWTLAIYSGLRKEELLGLGWADVDLDAGTLTVRRGLVGVKDTVPEFGEPKSETSRRTISIPADAVTALRAHKARQNEERLATADWADYGLVFTTHVGTLLIGRNVTRDFKLALKRAGLPNTVRFHDLRHAHATLMLRAGVPLKVASGRLGHSSITITGDLYQHWVRDMDVDAAEKAARAMRLAGPLVPE